MYSSAMVSLESHCMLTGHAAPSPCTRMGTIADERRRRRAPQHLRLHPGHRCVSSAEQLLSSASSYGRGKICGESMKHADADTVFNAVFSSAKIYNRDNLGTDLVSGRRGGVEPHSGRRRRFPGPITSTRDIKRAHSSIDHQHSQDLSAPLSLARTSFA